MRYLRHSLVIALQILVLLLGVVMLAHGAEEIGVDQTPHMDMVLKGDAKCTRCHDESEEYPVLSIGKTRHGTVADGRTPTCTSCHGESDTHINKPAGATERPKPERTFGKSSATAVASFRRRVPMARRRTTSRPPG